MSGRLDGAFDDAGWQARWEGAHELYMPGRAAMFDAVLEVLGTSARAGDVLRVLDLAGGPGSMAMAIAARFPDAQVTVLDIDPALLALAARTIERRTLGDRVVTTAGDLSKPEWVDVAGGPFDAVVVVMALHWFDPQRLRSIYAETRRVLRPGGVLINADRLPDGGLGPLLAMIDVSRRVKRQARLDEGVEDWAGWWSALRDDPSCADLLSARDDVLASTGEPAEFHPDVTWHLTALRDAGFDEVGVLWRDAGDAAMVARRADAT